MKFFMIIIIFCGLCIYPLAAQEAWYKTYEEALKDIDACQWDAAIRKLEKLISRKKQPNLHEPTYGIYYQDYLPYFHLGQAFFMKADYARALESFRQSEDFGAVKASPHYPTLTSLKNTAEKLLFPEQQVQSTREKRPELTPADSVLVEQIVNKDYSTALQNLQSRMERLQIVPVENHARAGDSLTFRNEYQRAVEAYLQGNYRSALSQFSQILDKYPQNNLLLNWTKKISSELNRLSIQTIPEKAESLVVTEKIITQTATPVFALQNPAKNYHEVRSPGIRLQGVVGDDIGIGQLTFTVNGELLVDEKAQPIQLTPDSDEVRRKFPFEVEIPLKMGKNQITLIAVDTDSLPHSEILPLTIIRKLPIYKTTLFLIAMTTILVLLASIFGLSKYIRYRIAIINKYNPYIAGAPILNEEMFFGREKLLQSILNTLHHNSLMLYGPRRIGKTSIQHQLRQRLEKLKDPDDHFIPIYIDLQGISENKFFLSMIEDIYSGCKSYYPETARPDPDFSDKPDYNGRDFSQDLRKIINFLQSQLEKKLKLVLLIDEVDELNHYSDQTNQRLRSVFMKSFAENLVAVLSGTHIRQKWESEGSPWYNFFEQIEIKPLEREAAIALIETPVKGIFEYDPAAIAKIIEYSQCYPYLIQKYCIYVVNRIIELKRRRVTGMDVEKCLSF